MNVEAIDMGELKEAIKALNETGEVDPKIKIVGTKKEKLIEQFIEAVETLADDDVDMPTVAIEFYNSLPEDEGENGKPEETEPDPEPKKKEKPEAKKKAEKKKAPVKKETKPKEKKAPAKKRHS